MSIVLKQLADLKYNEAITLLVIEKDDILSEMFIEDVKMSFSLVKTLSKENRLSNETKSIIFSLFNNLILTNSTFIERYVSIAEANKINVKPTKTIIETPVTQPEPEPIVPKKERAIPKRYGKDKIISDIEKQGGKPTNAQLTALEINDLKNIYAKLNTRLIKDMVLNDQVLSDEEYRTIRSTIGILKNKLKDILKKK
jgi:hypothetical protein